MATNPSNPQPPADEAEFLAWVEGEPLARDREQAVARAMGADRALARRLEAMRADRAAHQGIADVAAPAGLMSGVEAALLPVLERHMLLGLNENGGPVADHPPISIVQPVKRSIVQTFFADRVGRGLAVAAALLLMVGGATYLGTTYLSGRTAPRPTTIALGPGAHTAESRTGDARPTLAAIESPAAKVESAAAKAEPPAAALAAAPVAPPSDELTPASAGSDAPGVTIADAADYGANVTGPFLPDLDGARAAELAREGRLVIRVKFADTALGAQSGKLADRVRHGDQSLFRLDAEAPPAVVALLAPTLPPAYTPSDEAPARPQFAGDSKIASDLPEGLPGPPRPDWNVPPPQLVYLIQTRLDGGALDALKATLAGNAGEAQYEELADPLPQDGAAVLNPASVVWWNQAPAAWTWWASVPVVIDVGR